MEKIFGEIGIPDEKSIYHSYVMVSGWAFSTEEKPVTLFAYVNESLKDKLKPTQRSPIVRRRFPKVNPSLNTWFWGMIDLRDEDNGTHNIRIVAKTDTAEKTLKNLNIKLENQDVSSISRYDSDFVKSAGNAWDIVARQFMKYFVEILKLKPDEKILDVGCAFGRMPMLLTSYLNDRGTYDGFDVIEDAINWCNEKIPSSKFPNFHFKLVDLQNQNYNPDGKKKASKFTFPYDDENFDFVFLISVFTHMIPGDVENYISEIQRVIKKGGRCLITYFILNEESTKLMKSTSDYNFKYIFDGFRSTFKHVPEAAIAYDEFYIRKLYKKNNLRIIEPIRYGSWCGRNINQKKIELPGFPGFPGQDGVLASKI